MILYKLAYKKERFVWLNVKSLSLEAIKAYMVSNGIENDATITEEHYNKDFMINHSDPYLTFLTPKSPPSQMLASLNPRIFA